MVEIVSIRGGADAEEAAAIAAAVEHFLAEEAAERAMPKPDYSPGEWALAGRPRTVVGARIINRAGISDPTS